MEWNDMVDGMEWLVDGLHAWDGRLHGTMERLLESPGRRTTQNRLSTTSLPTTCPTGSVTTAHRNGITKPKGNKYASMKGVDPKVSGTMRNAQDLRLISPNPQFRRNARFAAQGSQKAVREARAAKAE
jgi:large subunit ribosomal protein L29e